jgi:hypothetical protein
MIELAAAKLEGPPPELVLASSPEPDIDPVATGSIGRRPSAGHP